MQPCILTLAIILAGQVGAGDDRYAPVVPPATTTVELGAPPASMQQAANTPPPSVTASQNPLRPNSQPASPPASTAQPNHRLTKVVKPAELLRSLVKPDTNQKLTGSPISLADAMVGARSRLQQSQRVQLYWQLSRATSDYHLSRLEELQLQSQRNGLLQPSQEWSSTLQAATVRKKVAYAAVQATQLRLQKALGRGGQDQLLIPTDLPHCGAYQSKYKQIFQGRTSPEALQLAELLPMRHQELTQSTAQTTAAQQWHRLVNQQRGAQGDTRLLLKAYEQLALQRRSFVEAAYRYNAEIARYTELAVPQEVDTIRLVSMLIQTPNSPANWQSGAVQRASAEEPTGRATAVDRYKPKTFADDTSIEAESASNSGSERSILVTPNGSSR